MGRAAFTLVLLLPRLDGKCTLKTREDVKPSKSDAAESEAARAKAAHQAIARSAASEHLSTMAVPLAADYGRAVDRDNGAAPSCDGAGMLSRLFARRRAEHVEVLVELSASACASPYLIARVSGPSVAVAVSPRNASLAASGARKTQALLVPLRDAPAGVYWLELRLVACVDRGPCVENPTCGALNAPFAFAWNGSRAAAAGLGCWRRERAGDALDALPGKFVRAMPTRFQAPACLAWLIPCTNCLPKRFVERHAQTRPAAPCDVARLQTLTAAHYAYVPREGLAVELAARAALAARDPDYRMCLIGDSHLKNLKMARWAQNLSSRIAFAQVNWPEQVAERARARFCRGARETIVNTGQWPLSNWRAKPYTDEAFEAAVSRMLDEMRAELGEGGRLWVLSIDFNPLAGCSTACPPADWRTPHRISSFNHILERAAAARAPQVTFVDLARLSQPLWDAAPDWNHPPASVTLAQSAQLLDIILPAIPPPEGAQLDVRRRARGAKSF